MLSTDYTDFTDKYFSRKGAKRITAKSKKGEKSENSEIRKGVEDEKYDSI
jgi:hypothetical protein